MAPIKRARPSFSPPRPGKPKAKSTSTSTSSKGRETAWKGQKSATVARKRAKGSSKPDKNKYEGKKGTRQALLDSDDEDDQDEEVEQDEDEDEYDNDDNFSRSKSRRKATTSLIDDEASASDSEDQEEEDSTLQHSRIRNHPAVSSSPEPDMILAEITHHAAPSTSAPIPENLIYKMLQHHFTHPEKTKMSADARDLVAKYLEVFVREAIARSAFERQERDKTDGGGGVKVGGFLEVDDLERAAVQLCLDF